MDKIELEKNQSKPIFIFHKAKAESDGNARDNENKSDDFVAGMHIFAVVGRLIEIAGETLAELRQDGGSDGPKIASVAGANDVIIKSGAGDGARDRQKIGILWFCSTNKGKTFIDDALALTRHGVDGLLIVKRDGIHDDEVPLRESPLVCAHKERIQICEATLPSIASALQMFDGKPGDPNFPEKVRQVAETYAVFQPIGVAVGHGARNDVTNRLLAPIRLLAELGASTDKEEIKRLWVSGSTATKNGGQSCWGNFSEALKGRVFDSDLTKKIRDELIAAKKNFEDKLWTETAKAVDDTASGGDAGECQTASPGNLAEHVSLPEVVVAAEALMTLMTENRRNAGIVTEVESVTVEIEGRKTAKGRAGKQIDLALPILPNGGKYRLLVVDDHWADWKPVLTAIVESIKSENSNVAIEIVYSPDGKMAWENAGEENEDYLLEKSRDTSSSGKAPAMPILAAAFQADAVLLDIMIGGENGLDVLREIRHYSERIPVLLWTTTRSQEITNQAQQANGVILKKTVETKALAASLVHWLAVGHNRRGVSLLNPFFDSVIKKPEYREYARDVSEWALKWMSGFHAANEIFRIFTDHGGRHFIRVLRYIEEALQPLLGGEHTDGQGYFVAGNGAHQDDIRQQEFLALYLAVFLHELGMFKIRTDEGKESDDSYVNSVRKLHAPRGMFLIEENRLNTELWVDEQGLGILQREMKNKATTAIRRKIAVLVGYHARCLDSMISENFLNPCKAVSEKRLSALDLADSWQMLGRKVSFKHFLEERLKAIREELSKEETERLRCFAAVLRLCDAIDKDETRNPPEYLAPKGLFILEEKWGAKNRETLKQMICREVTVESGKIHFQMSVAPPVAEIVSLIVKETCSDDDIAHLWRIRETEGVVGLVERLKRWNKAIESWLDKVWIFISEPSKVNRDNFWHMSEWINGDSTGLSEKGMSVLLSVTALFTGTEVADEYVAIVEAKLTDKIQLFSFEWESSQTGPNTMHTAKVAEFKMQLIHSRANSGEKNGGD